MGLEEPQPVVIATTLFFLSDFCALRLGRKNGQCHSGCFFFSVLELGFLFNLIESYKWRPTLVFTPII